MSGRSASIREKLRLGIEAARAGRYDAAREQFDAVLNQDAANIPALLWLAFISPSPHESLRLLNQVLALDPANERAHAGVRWARRRLDQDQSAREGGEDLRQQFFSADEDSLRQAKKGPLAHRARRTINPLIVIMAMTGILGLMVLGLGALVVVPPETLAAWWPTTTEPATATIVPAREIPSPAIQATAAPAELVPASILPGEPSPALPALPSPTPLVALALPEATPELVDTPVTLPGDDLVVADSFLTPAPPAPVSTVPLAHQPAYPGEKWIEVNVTTQQVTAWEGDVPVMSFVVSTGLPETPTVLGTFNIYWKLASALMIGPNYYLPEVPYTMYFYGSYALHGTYWHSNFGQPMSHGCVNLSTEDSRKLFEWADPAIPPGQTQVVADADNLGTLVVVHE